MSLGMVFSDQPPQIIVKMHPATQLASLGFISSSTVISNDLGTTFPNATCSTDGAFWSACKQPICSLQSSSLASCRSFKFEIPIGVLLPLTGDDSFVGTSSYNTLDLLVNSVGYDYPQLQLIVADTTSTSAGALAVTQQLYADGIRIFVGPLGSQEALTILAWSSQNATDA